MTDGAPVAADADAAGAGVGVGVGVGVADGAGADELPVTAEVAEVCAAPLEPETFLDAAVVPSVTVCVTVDAAVESEPVGAVTAGGSTEGERGSEPF